MMGVLNCMTLIPQSSTQYRPHVRTVFGGAAASPSSSEQAHGCLPEQGNLTEDPLAASPSQGGVRWSIGVEVTGEAVVVSAIPKTTPQNPDQFIAALAEAIKSGIGKFAGAKQIILVPELPKTRLGNIWEI
ncbi:hypothetical protein BDK51DRAFT_28427 [Blyttiomyces helicus]|uniref:AMP-binding enzyme C-terminal domain-containing protein n=1 Tax=Blyttiomyces helicus TaxID=388810 RepID=A0A4P9WGY4_9FUNG|nr:hypothetical protein BDK51DRAFT_28427 [Blyttiomyces helicus]|eukprot:RKO90310.1 hypothetical protein BDK51DRAFT_28427 [Blyttiomyces helicus]